MSRLGASSKVSWVIKLPLIIQSIGEVNKGHKTILLLFCLIYWAFPSAIFYFVVSVFGIRLNTSTVSLIVGHILSDVYYCIPITDAAVILRNRVPLGRV